jgi:hypothetical protein
LKQIRSLKRKDRKRSKNLRPVKCPLGIKTAAREAGFPFVGPVPLGVFHWST